MYATINNFISALYAPNDHLATLFDICVERNVDGEAEVRRTKHFADVAITRGSRRYILSLPLSPWALKKARRVAVRLRALRSTMILDYRVLPAEMNYIDARGEQAAADLLLQEIPRGELLAESIESHSPEALFEAIDILDGEFRRINLSHQNLKPDRVMVSERGELIPLGMHYLQEAEECDQVCCNPLREYVAEHFGVESRPFNPAHEPRVQQISATFGYDYVGNPFEGLCVVQNHAGYGYITTDGEELIPPQYLWAGDITEGRAEVETSEGMGLIDAHGRYIIEPKYQIVEFDARTGTSHVKQDEKWMIFDYEGRMIASDVELTFAEDV